MRRLSVGPLVIAILVTSVGLGNPARAGHWQGSITTPLNGARVTQLCHDVPYWFKPEWGWTRSCSGGVDTGNAYSSVNVYLRGYFWTQARMSARADFEVYYNANCTGW